MNALRQSILLALIAWLAVGCAGEKVDTPKVKEGRLDLSGWDFRAQPEVPLAGEWHFWWQDFVEPSEFANGIPNKGAGKATLPGRWEQATGYSTYALELVLPQDRPEIGLSLRNAMSSQKLYVVQGENVALLWTNGTLGKSREEQRRNHKPNLRTLGYNLQEKVILVWHVAHFYPGRGGAHNPLILGSLEEMTKSRDVWNIFAVGVLGMILFMGFYHLLLFAQRRDDRSSLWFGIFCVATAMINIISQRLPEQYASEVASEYFGQMYLMFSSIGLAGVMVLIAAAFFVHSLLPGRLLRAWTVASGTYFMTYVSLLLIIKILRAEHMMVEAWFTLSLDVISYAAALVALRVADETLQPKWVALGLVVVLALSANSLVGKVYLGGHLVLIFVHLVIQIRAGKWVAKALFASYFVSRLHVQHVHVHVHVVHAHFP